MTNSDKPPNLIKWLWQQWRDIDDIVVKIYYLFVLGFAIFVIGYVGFYLYLGLLILHMLKPILDLFR